VKIIIWTDLPGLKTSKPPFYSYHECCAAKTPVDVEVIYCDFYDEEQTRAWWLHVYKEATEEDLIQNHFLQYVGELMESKAIKIRFCPYCGKNLFEEASY
jgi:hypothetical protein